MAPGMHTSISLPADCCCSGWGARSKSGPVGSGRQWVIWNSRNNGFDVTKYLDDDHFRATWKIASQKGAEQPFLKAFGEVARAEVVKLPHRVARLGVIAPCAVKRHGHCPPRPGTWQVPRRPPPATAASPAREVLPSSSPRQVQSLPTGARVAAASPRQRSSGYSAR